MRCRWSIIVFELYVIVDCLTEGLSRLGAAFPATIVGAFALGAAGIAAGAALPVIARVAVSRFLRCSRNRA
ncbi:MAG: hypothetical protein DI556_13255 [Rhodovulum sulfidophilum]|uniref:Uncharacterized protein n=1 Tax=Rhodovulum sulfidophilum TaxID=35806 RepID=A0A2W5PVH1_RHOSU|nr:MAG: hypothetical protein DI556_13255 [Rhodovulum sulfidophilum]